MNTPQNVIETLTGYATGTIEIPPMVEDFTDDPTFADGDAWPGDDVEADYAAAREFG